jgi:hypothetical protein
MAMAVVAVMAGWGMAAGQSPDPADLRQRRLAELADLGPGVHKVKKDVKGRIQTLIVVGQSRVSTVLGKTKGLEVARTRAELAAKAEFIKFLKDKVTVRVGTDDESTTLLEGVEEAGQKDQYKESGKAIEKTSQQFTSVAEGLVRGLTLLGRQVSGTDAALTLVYGFDIKDAEAARKLKGKLDADGNPKGKPAAGDSKSGRGLPDKKVGDSSAVSDELDRFWKN